MKDFLNSDMGRWLLRLTVVVIAALIKSGDLPLAPVLGDIDLSNVLLGSAALVPSAPKR